MQHSHGGLLCSGRKQAHKPKNSRRDRAGCVWDTPGGTNSRVYQLVSHELPVFHSRKPVRKEPPCRDTGPVSLPGCFQKFDVISSYVFFLIPIRKTRSTSATLDAEATLTVQ